MIRLGFAVRAVGQPGLAVGGRRGSPPHLSVALAGLMDMLRYLSHIEVRFYRAALLLTEEDGFAQLAESADQLALLAQRLAAAKVRVSLHLPHGIALASADESRAAAAISTIEVTAALLAALDAARPDGMVEGIMVTHLDVPSADPSGYRRFAMRYRALSAQARARLAIEHGDAGPSLGQLLTLHQQCGIAVVFDLLHWELHNPEGLPIDLALGLALATWSRGVRPEVHLSSQRGEAHLLPGRTGAPSRVVPPRPGQHADYVAVADLARLLHAAQGLPPFDLMVEAKAGELAIARLRNDLLRRDPELAGRLA